MSIILKGIDLPKEGEEITLAIFHDGDIVSYKYWLPKEAEAIQIPTPHGRIADVGEGEKKMCGECQFKGDCLEDPNVLCTDREIFSLAPTILDEEGK